jgi:nitroimidazol reductase NimA-like FMN-containing flavoprotein (pyridoxamine 5'-phosphate oxidase superfamily)
MAAHAWLAETPWPTRQLPREELTARIEHFLATHWMGVLCTVGRNGPIGSPIEFHADGLVVYLLPQPGSPKLKAMQRDPRICLAAYGENSGWASVRGAQLFGTAEFLDPGTPAHDHAMSVYRWKASAEQLDRPTDTPPQIQLLKLDPERIVYTEQWLRKDGYGPRQIWHKDANRAGRSLQYGHD